MPTKHLPIQPNLAPMGMSGSNNVTIAPNLNPVPKERKKSSSSGIVIRTSKHWVLPPRPKPGRKPSVSTTTTRSSSISTNNGSSVNTSKATTPGVSLGPSSASSRASTPPAKLEHKNEEESSTRSSTRRATSEIPAAVGSSSRTASSIPLARPHAITVCKLSGTYATSKLASRGSDLSPSDESPDSADVCGGRKGNPNSKAKKPQAKKLTKTVLKKEIQQLKLQNYKLKQELGQLVGNLQELKQRYSLVEATLPQSSQNKSVPSVRKRSFVDVGESSEADNTDAFLKFEDDDENGPNPIIANVGMKQTLSFSSQYSSRTNLTDEEDTGFSSSTPSSLFSAELQRSMTNSSVPNASATAHHGQYQSNYAILAHSPHNHVNSPTSTASSRPPSSSVDAMVFLDDYEQMEFYSKHRQLFDPEKSKTNLEQHDQPSLSPSTALATAVSATAPSQSTELHLDVIKEEDMDFKFDHDFEGDDLSVLNFLETHVSNTNQSGTTAVANESPSWLIEGDIEATSNLFKETNLEHDLQKSELYMPPSLEELMDEQDITPTEKLLGNEIKNEDQSDLLQLDAFEFA